MEFETWDRDTLLKELKNAMALANFQPGVNLVGILERSKYYSDDELRKKSDHQLQYIYVQLKSDDEVFLKEYEAHQEKKRFFNQPSCNADFSYWCKQAYWSIDEAIALILGKDPRKITWDDVKKHIPFSPFANKFNELRELAKRYVNCKELYDPVFPGIFLAWAERMGISTQTELKGAVDAIGIQVSDWKGNYEQVSAQYNQLNKLYAEVLEQVKVKDGAIEALKLNLMESQQREANSFKEIERQSLLKLVATMSYDGYRYNPRESKSPTPKELSDAATKYLGEKIDTDTARKWLKESSSRYPNRFDFQAK